MKKFFIQIYILDRSEGGSSIHDGSVELMVHRRTLFDDRQGVNEPMNETAFGTGLVVRGQHYLVLEPPEYSALYHRPAAQHLFMNPIATYALPNVSYTDYSTNYQQTWSALSQTLPLNVHLLTFDQITSNSYLVRIEHYFEANEDETYSKAVEFDLQILFNKLGQISDTVELTLAGNLPLSDMERLVWKTNHDESSEWKPTVLDMNSMKSTVVTLNPMEIKTFQITLK